MQPNDEPITALAMKPNISSATIIKDASERATAVAGIINERGLVKRIRGKPYVQFEGWSTLAAQYGLVPSCAWSRRVDGGGWEAEAELRRMDSGTVIATAQSECGTEGDGEWRERSSQAQRSMAETRACSKVCRVALSWVMVLAGYAPTPAEEMGEDAPDRAQATARKPASGTQEIGKLRHDAGEALDGYQREHGDAAYQDFVAGHCPDALDDNGNVRVGKLDKAQCETILQDVAALATPNTPEATNEP